MRSESIPRSWPSVGSTLIAISYSRPDLPISRTLRIRGTRQNASTDHLRQNVGAVAPWGRAPSGASALVRRAAGDDRSTALASPGLGGIVAHTSTLRSEVAAGWHTFVAVSAVPSGCPPPRIAGSECAWLGHAAPAEKRADCPSPDLLVNRCASIRIDCCRMAASEWLIGAVALQT